MPFKRANFNYHGPFTLGKIADAIGAEIDSSAKDVEVRDLAPLHIADSGHLSFFDNAKYLEQFQISNATACIVHPKFKNKAKEGMILLESAEPYNAYALAAQLFYTPLDKSGKIHPTAVIEPDAIIGEGCSIGAFTYIGRQVVVGDDTIIGSNVTITSARIGRNCIIHSGARIGQDGFGFAHGKGGHIKVPQLGGVIIEDDVEIGANTTIDRGSGPNTEIGQGTKIDNLVQIAHNVVIGKYCFIVAQVGIAGSTKIGDYVQIGGSAAINGHIKIGNGAKIAATSGVMRDVQTGATVVGAPARDGKEFWKYTATLEKLVKERNTK
ncbi:MAG: UDP-3-O-(3-hydroxymyristoyl)glucosamine N-acyltransferase [Alphaproteobacteria bacterium CG11_big_fil_rev_8_21_14_0_20_44_7]|nr:MAG: UDP-3-O-(3-hydroxymyristoyl)glucosamine N-acyltransferase [Alphaproteobacteria bacterium CG11_big_fil_rev_8_21_14_0_20_44_7]